MKKSSTVCTQQDLATGSCDWQWKHAGELKSHASWSTIGKNFESGQAVNLRLRLTTQSIHKAKPPDHSVYRIFVHIYIYIYSQ